MLFYGSTVSDSPFLKCVYLLSKATVVPQFNSLGINCRLIQLNLPLLVWFILLYSYSLLLFEILSMSGFQHDTRV